MRYPFYPPSNGRLHRQNLPIFRCRILNTWSADMFVRGFTLHFPYTRIIPCTGMNYKTRLFYCRCGSSEGTGKSPGCAVRLESLNADKTMVKCPELHTPTADSASGKRSLGHKWMVMRSSFLKAWTWVGLSPPPHECFEPSRNTAAHSGGTSVHIFRNLTRPPNRMNRRKGTKWSLGCRGESIRQWPLCCWPRRCVCTRPGGGSI